MIAFSEKAYLLGLRVREAFFKEASGTGQNVRILLKVKSEALPELSEERSVTDICHSFFKDQADAIIFLSASGIAVRSIAPFIQHKSTDPAVLCIDEAGKYCIPLLSGHLGGANALSLKIAGWIGAEAIITTASDGAGSFSIDLFAKANNLVISDFEKAKRVASKCLDGNKISIYSSLPKRYFTALPEADIAEWFIENDTLKAEADVLIMYQKVCFRSFRKPIGLVLWAKCVYIGIGCRREVGEDEVDSAINTCLLESGIAPESIAALCSIERKKSEQGILAYTYRRKIPYLVFPIEKLSKIEGDFSDSEFVYSIVGIGNVCERTALFAAGGGASLLVKKRVFPRITIAMALGELMNSY